MKKLYPKYRIEKTNGKLIDPTAQYFVLRLDTDPAARVAMLAYAAEVERDGEVEFAEQIRDWVASLASAEEGIL